MENFLGAFFAVAIVAICYFGFKYYADKKADYVKKSPSFRPNGSGSGGSTGGSGGGSTDE